MQQILFVGPSDQVDDKKFVGPSGISHKFDYYLLYAMSCQSFATKTTIE